MRIGMFWNIQLADCLSSDGSEEEEMVSCGDMKKGRSQRAERDA